MIAEIVNVDGESRGHQRNRFISRTSRPTSLVRRRYSVAHINQAVPHVLRHDSGNVFSSRYSSVTGIGICKSTSATSVQEDGASRLRENFGTDPVLKAVRPGDGRPFRDRKINSVSRSSRECPGAIHDPRNGFPPARGLFWCSHRANTTFEPVPVSPRITMETFSRENLSSPDSAKARMAGLVGR
jgi:hypothetical protein